MTAGPVTLIGAFLGATARGDGAFRDELHGSLKETRWHDATGVIDAAFAEALRSRLGKQPTLYEVQKFTVRLFRIYKILKRIVRPKTVELVLRHGLGEAISLDQVDGRSVETVKMLTVSGVAADLKLTSAQIDEMLARAEASARQAGYHPTLLSDLAGGAGRRG